jgi:hypothetical protein
MKHCIFPRCDCPKGCKVRIPTITIWASNFGDIRLPHDFPDSAIRENGWFDRRYGIYPKLREYIAEQEGKLRTGAESPGFVAPPFATWMICGSPPNRLHGAAINTRGEAI